LLITYPSLPTEKKKNASSVNIIGLDWMLICDLHHPMDAETHNIPPEEWNKRSVSVGIRWLGGRSLHTTRSIESCTWITGHLILKCREDTTANTLLITNDVLFLQKGLWAGHSFDLHPS
jgi:hypothetical protein